MYKIIVFIIVIVFCSCSGNNDNSLTTQHKSDVVNNNIKLGTRTEPVGNWVYVCKTNTEGTVLFDVVRVGYGTIKTNFEIVGCGNPNNAECDGDVLQGTLELVKGSSQDLSDDCQWILYPGWYTFNEVSATDCYHSGFKILISGSLSCSDPDGSLQVWRTHSPTCFGDNDQHDCNDAEAL